MNGVRELKQVYLPPKESDAATFMHHFERNVLGMLRTALAISGDKSSVLIDWLNSAKLSKKQRELLSSIGRDPDELLDADKIIASADMLQSFLKIGGLSL